MVSKLGEETLPRLRLSSIKIIGPFSQYYRRDNDEEKEERVCWVVDDDLFFDRVIRVRVLLRAVREPRRGEEERRDRRRRRVTMR